MFGQGIVKGLWVTFKHFFNTYADDIKYAGRKYLRQKNFEVRQGLRSQGAFTVQYPDEKLAVPERFRFTPFLVTEDTDPARVGRYRSCPSWGRLVYQLRYLRQGVPTSMYLDCAWY